MVEVEDHLVQHCRRGVGFLANQITPISHHLPDWAATAYGALIMAANVGLRFITTDPIIQQKLDQ